LGGREEAVRRHNREVLGHLRRRLAVGEPATLLGSPYRLVTEEVRLEEEPGGPTPRPPDVPGPQTGAQRPWWRRVFGGRIER
jgi:hypothetical protein